MRGFKVVNPADRSESYFALAPSDTAARLMISVALPERGVVADRWIVERLGK